ncbi:MAG: hypothetical protein HC881_18250 [Leptolyngbyaceae cyanobacterium SL_7_1]|nr:hypothetical protein [Leptolyngbyaceae cyanobacterium SL_7_1]
MSLSAPDSPSSATRPSNPSDPLSRLRSESPKNQLPLIRELASQGDSGLEVLMNFLLERKPESTPVEGRVYQSLMEANTPQTQDFLQTHFPTGVMALPTTDRVDYAPLQQLLGRQEFEAADKITSKLLCELAGAAAIARKWLYFTDVERFTEAELHTIDRLWRVYSEGKFGFSVQRDLWLGVGKNWDDLWPLIGWKNGNNWTRYPQEFIWNLSAPKGHLPLSNQLRGVRVMAALLNHPAWNQRG